MPRRTILPDPAAVVPGELELLASVTENLADHVPKLVYADWLEEHDDPRGPFLRSVVRAVQDGTQLPSGKDLNLSKGWCETVGPLLLQRIRQFDLEPYRDRLLALARPVLELNDVALTTESAIPFLGSKLGGLPALPHGSDWPRCEYGPLKFLAQFNLAELRQSVAGQALPLAGLLSFFEYQNWNDGEHGNPRVIFTPSGAALELLVPPDDLDANQGRPGDPATFTIRESLDLPSSDKPWTNRLGFPGEAAPDRWDVRDRYWELCLAQRQTTHLLFGYARNRHIVCDPLPGPEWEQLISLTSDDTLQWGWGDGHELFWYIRSSDLRAGQFEQTETFDG